MTSHQGDTPGSVVMAFLAGAAVGAAAALLFAPVTGRETREYLGQRAREGRDRASDAARQGRDLLNRQRDNVVTAFERGTETGSADSGDAGEPGA
jgi:gas vesicle protein